MRSGLAHRSTWAEPPGAVLMVSILMMTGALGLFLCELRNGTSVETARTVPVNTVVVAEMFYLINSRYMFAPVTNLVRRTGNRYVLLSIATCIPLQIGCTHAPAMQAIFGSTGLSLQEWSKVPGAGQLLFRVSAMEEFVIRRMPLGARLAAA